MICPVCGGATTVIDTKHYLERDSIKRRRKCLNCDYRFLTIELDNDIYEKTTSAVEETMADLKKNAEGYFDPTAYKAIEKVDAEDARFHKLLYTLFWLCDLAGFRIDGRMTLVNKKTGRVWR